MSKNGKLISTDEEKAEVLNNFTASVCTGNLPPRPSPVDGLQEDQSPSHGNGTPGS